MNYSAMIQNRRSVHAFREKEVPSEAIGQLRSYYEKDLPPSCPGDCNGVDRLGQGCTAGAGELSGL